VARDSVTKDKTSDMFVLDTATLNVLGAYHDTPAIVTWNAKINGYS